MYSCVKAYTRSKNPGSRLTETLAAGLTGTVRSYLEAGDCQLILTNSSTVEFDSHYLLNLGSAADLIYTSNPDFTIQQWLTSLGNKTLETTNVDIEKIGVKKKSIKYNDLFNAGYDPQLAHPIVGDGNELPETELTDIKVTKEGADYEKVYRNCLFTVNGLLHLTDYSTAGIRITDGGKSVQHANANQLGMISFQQLGELTFIPIKREMMKPLTAGGKFKDGFSLSLGDIDLSDKVLMFSFGGVFHHSGQCYRLQGDNSAVIEWWKIPFVRRYLDTKNLIDFSAFHETLERNPGAHDALDMVQAVSDDSIAAYMEMTQTFAIVCDVGRMYWERTEVEQSDLPGRYYVYERPGLPLQLDSGFLAEYMAKSEGGVWTVAIDKGYTYNYYGQTKPPEKNDYVPDAELSTRPFAYSRAWLLELGYDYVG